MITSGEISTVSIKIALNPSGILMLAEILFGVMLKLPNEIRASEAAEAAAEVALTADSLAFVIATASEDVADLAEVAAAPAELEASEALVVAVVADPAALVALIEAAEADPAALVAEDPDSFALVVAVAAEVEALVALEAAAAADPAALAALAAEATTFASSCGVYTFSK
jgi:hypothetical protein